ncbi:MAG: MATE family efflux transporter [Erysipelotrichaceae bacterium]|nr:MATE family efflux transporter [Erysipelotrichaceae bacterium]
MAKSKAISLTEGDIRKLIFTFSWPVFVSMIFSELYNITNSLIVGNYVSLQALSAVSACTWICNIFNYAFYGLGMGAGIIIARYYGAKNFTMLKKALDSSIVFAIIGGLILTGVSEALLPLIMRLCNIAPDIYDLALSYMRVYLLGNSAVLTSQMCFFILRSFGDTRHQLYFSIVSSMVNITLGMLFVRVFNLSVIGTALATIISQFVTDVLTLRLVFNYEGINFDFKNIDFSFEVVKEITTLGIPAGFQNMLIALSSMLVQSHTNRFSNQIISGIGVGEKIINWGQLPSVAMSGATMSLVAQNMGADKYDRVQKSISESAKISSIITCFMIVIIYIAAPYLTSQFNDDPQVAFYGTEMIRTAIYSVFFINLSHIYNAACRAAGNVRTPMYIAIFSQVLCKYLFVDIGLRLFYDVHVLYLGTGFGYTVAGILATLYFYRSRWTRKHKLLKTKGES